MNSINGDNSEARVDELPSINGAMEELRRHARSHWLDMARDDQSHRWRHGVRIIAEEYFARIPELRENHEDSLVLICGEIHLRREIGDHPTPEEYERRFPELAPDIKLQFDVDQLLSQPSSDDNGDVHLPAGFAPSPDAVVPDTELELPGYEFLRRIGGGGFGSVFQARQISLNRFVAIKVLANLHGDSKLLARQEQEAEILARLHHPNIVHIYEVISRGGWLYLVMEYIDGAALDETLAGKPLPSREAAQLLYKLAETVEAVHAAGILHRDLKPSNVLLTNAGELKISDFSLAKIRSDDPSLTVADDVLGTPSYMAPEQARGEAHRVGPEADVYSLGAILYELLTGRPPFLGATVLDTLALIRTQDPVPPGQLQPKTPRDLQTICLQCLNKSPDARYRTAAELCDDLLRYLNGQPILARRPGLIDRTSRFIRRHPALSILTGAAIIVTTASVAAKEYSDAKERRASAAALVDAIATADVQALPQLLRGVSEQSALALPLLRGKKQAAAANQSSWLNLSIAELTADPNASAEPLLAYLPSAQPAEVRQIVMALKQRADEIHDPLWQMLLDDSASDAARLRLACLAAHTAPTDDSWPAVSPAVCRSLVEQHPFDIAAFTSLLRPARSQLVPALVEQIQTSDLDAVERRSAVSILTRFITNEVDSLVALAVDSQPDEFALLVPALEAQRAATLPQLKAASGAMSIEQLLESHPTGEPREIERDFDRAIRKNATAAIAAWRLGDRDIVYRALKGDDASLRAWLIELLMPLGVTPGELLDELKTAGDARYRQALILALGQTREQDVAARDIAAIRSSIAQLLRTDSDAGVHAACRWLLARLGTSEDVSQLKSEFPIGPSPDRRWFYAANGHLFSTMLIPADFRTGSPVTELWRETDEVPREDPPPADYTIAVAAYETTVEQFQKFKSGTVNRQYSATPDCPMNNVSWYDAASYCRWLSEREGVAEDQMVFPPVDQIGPDMKLPNNWLARTGYRLPLEREFEFACRAGTTTSRYCGSGRELLPYHAWHLNCSDDHAWPVGTLKPNSLGLFDMLGNVAERCIRMKALSQPPNIGQSTDDGTASAREMIPIGNQGLAIGGDFGDLSQNIRAARRAGVPAGAQWATIGFRVVRTTPKPQ